MVPASEEGIRKVLERLSRQGVVTPDRVGPAIGYRFNTEHLAASAITELARLRSTLLARLEEALALWRVPPIYAAVFGSVGRGDADEGSDIDLFVVRPRLDSPADDDVWSTQVADLVLQVRRWTGNELEVVEYEESELEVETAFLADVRDHGLTVYGLPAWFRREARRWRGADPGLH